MVAQGIDVNHGDHKVPVSSATVHAAARLNIPNWRCPHRAWKSSTWTRPDRTIRNMAEQGYLADGNIHWQQNNRSFFSSRVGYHVSRCGSVSQCGSYSDIIEPGPHACPDGRSTEPWSKVTDVQNRSEGSQSTCRPKTGNADQFKRALLHQEQIPLGCK
jgi:hypothetical protein